MQENRFENHFWLIVGRVATVLGIVVAVITIVSLLYGAFPLSNKAPEGVQPSVPASTTFPFTATPAPSPTSTPLAQVPPHTTLCNYDSSSDWQTWHPTGSWETLNRQLLNSGQVANGYYDLLLAPAACQPPSGNPDYQVDMQIQAITCGGGDLSGFGAFLRINPSGNGMGGYVFYVCSAFDSVVIDTGDFGQNIAYQDSLPTGTATHTYTMRVQGNTETLLRDGVVLLQGTDNTTLTAGQIGLFCSYGNQIVISSFTVTTLA